MTLHTQASSSTMLDNLDVNPKYHKILYPLKRYSVGFTFCYKKMKVIFKVVWSSPSLSFFLHQQLWSMFLLPFQSFLGNWMWSDLKKNYVFDEEQTHTHVELKIDSIFSQSCKIFHLQLITNNKKTVSGWLWNKRSIYSNLHTLL